MNENPHSDPDRDETRVGPSAGAERMDVTGAIIAGRYRILRRLGEGAMGAVYLGEHLKIGRKDAIKVLRGGLATDAESIARFNRGARNLSAIRHPNVCTLYDYGETEDGSPFLALEFITGETLKDLMAREGRLGLDRALRIACQIADALQAAHDAGIVHRDLKPANVMLEAGRDGSDIVKVVDFDIAKGPEVATGEELTRLGYVVGTPEYMSPEQLMGERLDGRSDIYSLGIVLFRMLTGAYPFEGRTDQEIMVQRLTAEPRRIEQVMAGASLPAALQRALDRTLARDREARFARADEVSRELAAIMAGGAGTAASSAPREPVPETRLSPTAPVAVSGRPARSRRPVAGVAVAAVLVMAGIVTATQLMGKRGTAVDGGSGPPPSQPVDSGGSDTSAVEGGGSTSPPNGGGDTNGGGSNGRGGNGSTDPETPSIVVAPADATDVLYRMLDLTDPTVGGNAAMARVARDTARAVYDAAGMTTLDRALAAYVLATAARAMRDGAECERWIRRALYLRPGGPGYSDYLVTCRAKQ